jgi:hypothetical protein
MLLRRGDSNSRPTSYEPVELPLLYFAINKLPVETGCFNDCLPYEKTMIKGRAANQTAPCHLYIPPEKPYYLVAKELEFILLWISDITTSAFNPCIRNASI